MNDLSCILAATDFSAAGDRAVRRAALIARQHDAELHLLHAVPTGFEVVAPDLPGYGLSQVPSSMVSHENWVQCVSDLVHAEQARRPHPIVLFGCSLGGSSVIPIFRARRHIPLPVHALRRRMDLSALYPHAQRVWTRRELSIHLCDP